MKFKSIYALLLLLFISGYQLSAQDNHSKNILTQTWEITQGDWIAPELVFQKAN